MTKRAKTNVVAIATRPDVTWTPELKDGKSVLQLVVSQHLYAHSSIVLTTFPAVQAAFFVVHARGSAHPRM